MSGQAGLALAVALALAGCGDAAEPAPGPVQLGGPQGRIADAGVGDALVVAPPAEEPPAEEPPAEEPPAEEPPAEEPPAEEPPAEEPPAEEPPAEEPPAEEPPAEEPPAEEPEDGIICGRTNARAEVARRPVDVLWIIDSSPSMDDEIAIIQAKLNDFTAQIAASGLDYRVALVGAEADLQTPGRDYFGICIPPPLSGAPGCPDTNSERYLHVRAPVHSRDGLDVMLGQMDQLRGFLRPDARLHVVMVSDDDHRQQRAVADLVNAGLGADLVFHSIVTFLDYVGGCGVFDPDEECSCGESRGRQYIAMSEQTGGRVLDLCSEDWDPLFAALNEEVEEGARIPCGFDIPEVRGAMVDPGRINVSFVSPAGERQPLFNVDDCAQDPQGWTFDDPVAPQRVLLCPGSCGAIAGEVEIEFGCVTRKAPD